MKALLQLTFLCAIVFLIARQLYFFNPVDPNVENSPTITSHSDFNQYRGAMVGKQLKFIGTVRNSTYALGIGYYELVSEDNERIGILCNHYPPLDGTRLVVLVQVKPIVKLKQPVTCQVEVGIVEPGYSLNKGR